MLAMWSHEARQFTDAEATAAITQRGRREIFAL